MIDNIMEETYRMETSVPDKTMDTAGKVRKGGSGKASKQFLRSPFWRCICCLLCICLLLQMPSVVINAVGQTTGSGAEAVTFSALNDEAVFIKQSQTKLCTLAAATMMIRRAAMLSGNQQWQDITETSVRKDAWVEKTGLKWDFKTAGITVSHKRLSSTEELIQLLAVHPEGIAVYNVSKPHAILITDYTDGIFYCSDPAKTKPAGRYPVSEASITVASAGWYWYVKSPENLTVEMDKDPQDPANMGQAGADRQDGFQFNSSQNGNQANENDAKDNQSGEDMAGEILPNEKEYQAGGLTYRILNEKGKAAACTGQVKSATTVSVPATVKINGTKYKILQIAAGAFEKNTKLKSVTVGENVTAIGERAFSNCTKLKKIVLKSANLQKIGTEAFAQIHKQVQIQLQADLSDSKKQMDLIGTFAALLTGTSLPGTATIKIN